MDFLIAKTDLGESCLLDCPPSIDYKFGRILYAQYIITCLRNTSYRLEFIILFN